MSLLHSLDGELRLFVGLPEMPKHFLYLSMKLGRNKLDRLIPGSIFSSLKFNDSNTHAGCMEAYGTITTWEPRHSE